jgi:hypothetical protein
VTSASELIRGAKLRRDEFRVCVDPDLVDGYEQLLVEQAAAREAARDSLAGGAVLDIQTRLDELLEAMEAATVTLVLQALPRREYRALVDKYPPRKDDEGKPLPRDERFGVDYDAFYSELARRSIVEPALDAATLDILLDEKLSDGQWEALTTACARLNRSTVDVPFSPASSPRTRRSTGS